MADLISSLAGQIVALINSKPTSPTKEDLIPIIDRALLDDWMERERLGLNCGSPNRKTDCQSERLVKRDMDIIARLHFPCIGSTDGSHSFKYDVNTDMQRCPCGATKP